MEEDGFLRRNGNNNLLVGAAVAAAASTMLNVVAEEEEEELRRRTAKKRRHQGGSETGKAENVKRDFVGAAFFLLSPQPLRMTQSHREFTASQTVVQLAACRTYRETQVVKNSRPRV